MYEDFSYAISKFLRTQLKPFTLSDFSAILKKYGEKATKGEILEFLHTDDRVFSLENHRFITRAGAFTGCFFSFVPIQQELDQHLFVPGDRCIPFVDSEPHSCQLNFIYNGKKLPKKVMEIDCNTARDFFTFFGDEYASQYIASDPVNIKMDIANNDFELPPKLKLSGVSLEPVFADTELKKGDRIICRLVDWDRGTIEIYPIANHKKNPFLLSSEAEDMENWNKVLENSLLDCFETNGPCASMEQQLSYAFYDERIKLCGPGCGSIHEFLNETKKVDMELFGVETRLWKKGESVPAIGNWNKEYLREGFLCCFPDLQAPDCIVDCFIKDQLYEKKSDPEKIVNFMIPEAKELSDEEATFFTLQIKHRNAILREHYNWFADFPVASLRHKALNLYTRFVELISDIDSAGDKLEQFPQQELITLTQLFANISRILERINNCWTYKDEDETALKLSLEGMEYNFEDIRPELKSAVEKVQAGKFKALYC